jgi:hypothetical protein
MPMISTAPRFALGEDADAEDEDEVDGDEQVVDPVGVESEL